jgi:hypothetical protein
MKEGSESTRRQGRTEQVLREELNFNKTEPKDTNKISSSNKVIPMAQTFLLSCSLSWLISIQTSKKSPFPDFLQLFPLFLPFIEDRNHNQTHKDNLKLY